MNLESIAHRLSLLENCSNHFEFPAGGVVPIPLSSELAVVEALRTETLTDDLTQIRERWSSSECYGALSFAVRMGILAARTGDVQLFRIGLLGLLFDAGKVDYRDLLGALSILELSAERLQLKIQTELAALSGKLDPRTLETVEGYIERPQDMRRIESFGYSILERAEGFTISR